MLPQDKSRLTKAESTYLKWEPFKKASCYCFQKYQGALKKASDLIKELRRKYPQEAIEDFIKTQ